MGTWGTGIFADDLAADVRADWRDAVTEGLSPADATARLIARYRGSIDDSDESARFWMALAAAQSETGRLQDDVRDRALHIIAQGADIEQFEPQDRGRRRKAVESLGKKLAGPQRATVKLKESKAQSSPVSVGDVIQVRGQKRSVLYLVVGLTPGWPSGTQWPVVAALRTSGDEVPAAGELATAPLVRDRSMSGHIKDPVVDYEVVSGPSRGPRSFPNFGKVVAQGVHRPDAPRIPEPGELNWDAKLAYTWWQSLPALIDGEAFERKLELTDEFEATRPKGPKALWRRLDHFRQRKAVERKIREVTGRD